jgi:hypothetical protein
MLRKLRRVLLVAAGLLVLSLACRYLWPLLDPGRPRISISTTPLRSQEGVLGAARRTDGAGMYWLDNQRLLAVADVLPEHAKAGRYIEPTEKSLYVWNTQTKAYRRYRELPLHDFSGLCHYRGKVWYRSGLTDIVDFAIYWAGEFGSEVEIRMPMHDARADYFNGDRFLNMLSCNEQFAQQTLRPEHRKPISQASVVWLRQEDGYILLSDPLDPLHRDPAGYAVYYRADGSAPVTLPIRADLFDAAGIEYSEFGQEYVITPGSGAPRANDQSPAADVYFMKVDGSVQQMNFPGQLGLSGNASFPTQAGLFLPQGPIAKPGEPAGAWLYRNGKLYPVDPYSAGTVAVSPDGCKIAADVRNNPKVVSGTIRIIDVCPQ